MDDRAPASTALAAPPLEPAAHPGAVPRPSTVARLAGALGVLAAIAYGTYERWWVAAHPLGTLTSDGAVVGLMALHLLHHGQLPAYMWGQSYGGSLEAALTAGVFAVAGVGTSQLLATTALTSALATFALWRCGRRLVGDPAAAIGALAFWVWPSLFLWRSLKPGGTYVVALALALCAVGALARVRAGDVRTTLLVTAGVWSGLAFWSSPMSLQLLVPAVLWCAAALWSLRRRLWWVVGGGALGALPALVFAATHHASNLAAPSGGSLVTGFPSRLWQFFDLEAPIALALRVEGSLRWVLGPVSMLLYAGALVGLVTVGVAVRRGRAARCTLPVLTLALLPLLFALNRLANHPGQGRYVLLGSSMAALLVGVGLENAGRLLASRWRVSARSSRTAVGAVAGVGLVLLAVLGGVAIRDEPPRVLAEFPAGGVLVPPHDGALRDLVAAHHVRFAYAPYWLAYRLTFETDEHTIVVPTATNRYPPYTAAVAASPHPAYLFMSAAAGVRHFESWCAAHDVAVRIWRRGPFTMVQPATRVVEATLPKRAL